MSKLVEKLKDDHIELTDILNELQCVGATSAKGKELLIKSKQTLLAHLKLEDNELYPPLYKQAEGDASLKRTLDTFGKEMDRITEFVNNFYTKYTNVTEAGSSEFSKDIANLIVSLKNRIMKEEIAIYKAYDKIFAD